jgi:Bacterial Ig domain
MPRSEGFRVRRWLQLGAASAGMSAALWGFSALGPATAPASAETPGSSSDTSSESTKSDADTSSESVSEAKASDSEDNDTSDEAAADETDDAVSEDDAASEDDVAPQDDGAPDDHEAPEDDDESESGSGVAESDDDATESSGGLRVQADESAPVSEAASLPVDAVDPETDSAAAAVVTDDPWATEVETPQDPHREAVAAQIDSVVESAESFIAVLPFDDPSKEFLNEVLFLVRRTFLNQAPVVTGMQFSGSASAPVAGRIAALDPEGDTIVYRLVRGPESGTVVINADGTYTYTPGDDFNGVATFAIAADDLGLHVNLLDLFRPWATRADVLVNQGAIDFEFDFIEGPEHWTPERREALNSAADYLARYFLVRTPVSLQYEVRGYDNPDSEFLASASSGISTDPGFSPTMIQYKMLTGEDVNGAGPEGAIDWNFAYPWALDGEVQSDEFDFRTIAMHELMHSFGFSSQLRPPGYNPGTNWSTFASFIVTRDGRRVFGDDFHWDEEFDPNLIGADGGLYFDGAGAVAAYGRPVPLYTPDPWSPGSSMSHLDDDTFIGVYRQLMLAYEYPGRGIRVLSPVELGIMQDLGYSVVLYPALM